MSDCTAIYPAKPIECLLGAGHDGDHAGEDSAGFQFRWSKPNADMVPAARLDAANLEIARLKALLADARYRLDEAWGTRPAEIVNWETTDWRPLSVREALRQYDAALHPKEPSDG